MLLDPKNYLDWQTRLVYSDWLEEESGGDFDRQRILAGALRGLNFRPALSAQVLRPFFQPYRIRDEDGVWHNPDYVSNMREMAYCAGRDDFYLLSLKEEEVRRKECLQRIVRVLVHVPVSQIFDFYFMQKYDFYYYFLEINGRFMDLPFHKDFDILSLFDILVESGIPEFRAWIDGILDKISVEINKKYRRRKNKQRRKRR